MRRRSRCAATRSCRSPYSASDRKSTRLNSSHSSISYAVFCLKKKIANQERHYFMQRSEQRFLRNAVTDIVFFLPLKKTKNLSINKNFKSIDTDLDTCDCRCVA